jgi:FKBP-type peptidyl-prolyl cis-trans isomerase
MKRLQTTMNKLILLVTLSISVSAVGQTKSELEAKIKSLQVELEQLKKSRNLDLTDPVKRASYGMGVLIASNIKSQGADSINTEAFTAGVLDIFGNQPLKIDQQQCNSEVQKFMTGVSERKAKRLRAAGENFLEANKLKPNVKVTSSGLQYEVITPGTGKQPTSATDRVTVHYTGKLVDGTIFDSSVQRGQPATFALNQVIAGWTEGLQLMKEGDKWMFCIPYQLGYGERGKGGQIPPYSTLIFEVELIKFN